MYQYWRILGIILSFTTSFNYAYYAAFLHRMDEEELMNFRI